MVVYVLFEEIKELDYTTPKVDVINVYENVMEARQYILEKELEMLNREKQCKICRVCEADFDNETNPPCYKQWDDVDPACKNEVFEYPKKRYWVKEYEVIENPHVTLEWIKNQELRVSDN